MTPKSKALPDHRRLLWALLIVASATSCLVLAKAETGKAISKQEAGIKTSVAAAPAQIKLIDSQASISQHQPQQQVAEKKQGDQMVDSLFNSEEYVQIKPEEINGEVSNKDLIDSAALALSDLPNASPAAKTPTAAASQQSPVAEHKSAADDELSAHLAQDSIGALESGPRPYAAPADPRAARPYGPPPAAPRPYDRPPRSYGLPRARRGPAQHRPMPPPPGYGREPRAPMPPGNRYPGPRQLPGTPGYISSMVPHAPRPTHYGAAPQTPYLQGPPTPPAPSRYLPRGAAAGYAAFREFVRAQANRYKGQQVPAQPMGSHEPVAYNAAPSQTGSSSGSGQALVEMAAAYRQPSEQKPYQPSAELAHTPKGQQAYSTPGQEQYQSGPSAQAQAGSYAGQRSKVGVAQAYIPHMAPTGGHQSPAAGDSGYQANTNPVLAKLYGGHAPQGVGRPEYSKDYGMVIHYPQATVYTEPMTVDQLHKLAGGSITQILEQLQYNLASGQRNEANTIRVNNKHHLGHGLAIHAKEYYAPTKSGHYVPTTAAVISNHESSAPSGGEGHSQGNSAPAPSYSSETPQAPQAGGHQQRPAPAGYQLQNSEPAGYGGKPELGSGYERVKAAVAASAASAMKYGSASGSVGKPNYQSSSAPQQSSSYPSQQQAHHGGGLSGLMKPYEPLGALANIIGSELESLYNKANSVLSKQIDPELHAHVQAHLKSLAKVAGPLKYSEHDHRSPLTLRPAHSNGASYNGPPPPPPPPPAQGAYQPQGHYQGPPPHMQHGSRGRGPRRPVGYEIGSTGAHPPGQNRHQNGPRPHPGAQRPAGYHQQQQRQQAYNAEQQVFQQQVNQMLNDFNLGEDNYGAKSQPTQATNQGYPSKVMQKYQQQQHPQQQHPQQQQHSANAYEHGDGLEIPQGPNDQIGEISELIEALRGSLDGQKPEHGAKDGKTEDAQYIASALGQVPSYAIQVPVGQQQPQSAGEQAVYEAARKAAEQQQQQYAGQAPAAYQTPNQHTIQHVVQQYEQPAYQQVGPQVSAQLPYLAPPAPATPTNYESAPSGGSGEASASYNQQPNGYDQQQKQQQQPQAGSYGQYRQQSAGPQHESGYRQQTVAQAEAYGNQQQQQQDSYASSQQQAGREYLGKSGATDYSQQEAAAPAGYEAQAQGGGYQQEQQPAAPNAPVEQPAQQQQSGYTSTGHTQVINHLVPAQQQQAADYGQSKQAQPLAAITTSVQHQPVNQISVAAPTESQYQSAQPLSSFVESLPSDYQELLRQPAHASIMESLTNVPSDQQQEQLYSNATTSDLTKASIANAPMQQQHHLNHHHQRRQYDSHHLSGSASSPKATYLQVPAASSASSSSSASKSSAQAPSSQSSSSSVISSISSSSTSTSSSSSSPSSPSAAASASPSSSSSSAKASSTSQHDS